jgi:eukaryotic-like serine/threonine-protein kinase
MADYIGEQLGNYRLTRLLGQGGFADVYLGEHIYLRTRAAVKVLRARLSNENDLEGFLNEARTVAHLSHSNIVRVLDFGVTNETPFLVTDYAPNGTLRQRHPKGTLLPISTIIPYVKNVSNALQYAHDKKLIHRDVKPENMLLGEHHEILLSDFGIALIAQSSRHQSMQDIVGTVAYMAPEQIQGKPRAASDQYSLGIVVYEWLSGSRPFQGSFTELCTQHMFVSPPPLREKVPTIDPAVEYVVNIALAKEPKERFGSVTAFANALEQATRGQPILPAVYAPPLTDSSPSIALSAPSQQALDQQLETLVREDRHTESVRLEPTLPAVGMPFSRGQSTPVLYAIPPETPRDVVSPSPQKHRLDGRFPWLNRRSSWVIGGIVGLILFLVGFMITMGLIMGMWGGPSATRTQTDHIIRKWAFTTGLYVYSSPTVVNGVLYVGSYDNKVYAIDANAGQQKWVFSTNGAVYSSPTVVNGVLYVGSNDHKVYAVDASTGQQKWVFTAADLVQSSPTVVNGVLYVGSNDHKVYALDANTGQQKWAFPTGGVVWSSPMVVNGVLYIGSDDHKVYALDASTGQQKWTFFTGNGAPSSPMVVNGVLYVGSSDGKVYAIDAITSQQKWILFTGDGVPSLPTVVSGVLYVGSRDHKVYALDASTGQQKWTFPTGGPVRSWPTVVDGVLYVGSSDGDVYALDASTGQQKWAFPTGSAVVSSPTVVNGVLYVGSGDGKVYALILPASSS